MKDKRISLRFREDNALESEAWKCLEDYAKKKNISKNAALIDLILSGGNKDNSVEEMAERIADAVAEKLTGKLVSVQADSGAKIGTGATMTGASVDETVSHADEPELLGEDALDFLDMFG